MLADAHIYGGLAVLAAGMALLLPALGLVTVGVGLVALGVMYAIREAQEATTTEPTKPEAE